MKEFNKPIFCKNCELGYALIMDDDEYDYSEFICKACSQPERLSEKTYYRNSDGSYPHLEPCIGSDSLTSMET